MEKADNQPMRAYLAVALAVAILYLAYRIYAPFFIPLFWGAVLGVLFYPIYRRLDRLLRHHSMLSSLLLTIAVFFLVLIPALAIAFELVTQAIDIFQEAQKALGGAGIFDPQSVTGRYVWPVAKRLGITPEELRQALSFTVQKVGSFVLRLGPLVIGNVVQIFVNILLTLVALYYAFRGGPVFLDRIEELMPLPRPEVKDIVTRLHRVVSAGILSTFVIAVAQAVAAGLLFWALGLPRPLLWALAAGLASMVPAVGAAIIWTAAVIYLLAVGDYGRAAVLAALGVVVVVSIDHFLRPLIVHERVRIHNFYLFFGILGGIYLVGLTGVLLGPIVVALSLEVLKIYKERRGLRPPTPADLKGAD